MCLCLMQQFPCADESGFCNMYAGGQPRKFFYSAFGVQKIYLRKCAAVLAELDDTVLMIGQTGNLR